MAKTVKVDKLENDATNEEIIDTINEISDVINDMDIIIPKFNIKKIRNEAKEKRKKLHGEQDPEQIKKVEKLLGIKL